MAIKKSELYSSLWRSCDELRGGMDASQYKDYVLVLLFVKYVSDKYGGQKDVLLDVPEGAGFADMVALKGDKEIGDKINKLIGKLADANDLKGVIDVADFNDADKLGKGKEMVDRLSNLVAIFDTPGLNFKGNMAEGDDIMGDAYEYLMRHFATESGKSKGQFYTPAEVSRILARVVGIGSATWADQTIHDLACGSGSLLLKAHDEAKDRTGLDLTIYGQEMDNATAALAKMNMILHNCPTAIIHQDNSLSTPFFKQADGTLKTFDFVVANPPFSTKAWSNVFNPAEDEYNRFGHGIPPAKNGDYAFLLHVLSVLKSTGKGAVILPHGVLFRGNAEADIRKAIVKKGYLKGIIGLPANLFYGTGIPACVLVLDKENDHARKGVFMIDASKGLLKDGNKNRLRAQDMHKIVDAFNNGVEIAGYSRLVPLSEIADPKNDYNLNLPRYIDGAEPEDIQDLSAHLQGGIPNRDLDALAPYWQVLPSARAELFAPGDRSGYSALQMAGNEVKAAIFAHPEFTTYNQTVTARFARWKAANTPPLMRIAVGDHPKKLIASLSESLLSTFQAVPLLDAYDVYQHLMDYWAETLQDDVYLLVLNGWKAVLDGLPNTDLLPPPLLVARFFAADAAAIEQLQAARDAVAAEMEELDEEHGGEDGLLADAKSDKGKLTKTTVKLRLGDLAFDPDADEERSLLTRFLALSDKEAAASKQVKDARLALDSKVAAKYPALTESEVKSLVVDDKWLARLAGDVQGELDRVSSALTERIQLLAERYASPLPVLACEAVEAPGDTLAYLTYFCGTESGDAAQLKANEPNRLALYKLTAALLRAYANLANELGEAGYTSAEIAKLQAEVDHFEKARSEVKLASGDYIDLKMYEPAMRHLIDTYIRAEESDKISAFDDLSLVQLIVERGTAFVDALPAGIKGSQGAVAETIENNVRKLIIDETPINPKYYETMSALLDALIAQRKSDALSYKEYLAKVVALTAQVQNPAPAGSYPAELDSPAKRALYDNLDRNKDLALAVNDKVVRERQDDWRSSPVKTRKVKYAIKEALSGDEALTERVLELVKNQYEY